MEQRNFRASSSRPVTYGRRAPSLPGGPARRDTRMHRVLAGQTYGVHAVAFSPDGRQLASIARTARPGCGMGRQRER